MNKPPFKVFITKKKYDAIYVNASKSSPKYINISKYLETGLYYRKDFELLVNRNYGEPHRTSSYKNAYGITFSKNCKITHDINKTGKNKILILDNFEDYEKFYKKYKGTDTHNDLEYDWKQIKKDFGGI